MTRGNGERAQRSDTYALVRHAHAHATERAIRHHELHRGEWTERRRDELLAVFGVRGKAATDWATRDLQEIARQCATRAVDAKLAERLDRIRGASHRMSLTGTVRETRSPVRTFERGDARKASRAYGLGE